MRKFIFLLSLLLIAVSSVYGTTRQVTLHLNPGTFNGPNGETFPGLAFNFQSTYDQAGARILANVGDSIALTLVNQDTVIHGFRETVSGGAGILVLAGDTGTYVFACGTEGVFYYWDHANALIWPALGANGMIVVSDWTGPSFYWNIREYQKSWNEDLSQGIPVNFNLYEPDFFVLNGQGKAKIALDSSAVVRGQVGDTIHILVLNSGFSAHSLHFHGYHVRILNDPIATKKVGRIKDTVPIDREEGMILELVPDKPGKYPVHDHNLIAISGGGIYPSGIFLMMEIDP